MTTYKPVITHIILAEGGTVDIPEEARAVRTDFTRDGNMQVSWLEPVADAEG